MTATCPLCDRDGLTPDQLADHLTDDHSVLDQLAEGGQ